MVEKEFLSASGVAFGAAGAQETPPAILGLV